ncbi:NAD(P)/FAD-dependent oxidoreductase [Streptomyces sp. HD]|uniref:NAD(P)/FAD-dependent oxidoreductase n=1 Tax=Streptomyces sp. HD TaxID=3020892 RepID=UPI00232FC9D6|nr:NAD(P)/FAD-dependent oxidoreductase [Streptomyces sp. HD]MDC0766355.1 NAD(P)/FAD-dependent oxidoreductase [Streptomyces sp. HD]
MTSNVKDVDVVVIGGGPGGSVAAATLAKAGRSVLLVEQRRFPRFHIGESMLPYSMGLFERMGIADHVASQGYVIKPGAEFIVRDAVFRIPFADQGPDRHPVTYQVERSRFDAMLLQNARDQGAMVLENASVTEVLFDDAERAEGVRFQVGGLTRTVTARHVIDAGGRSSRIAKQLGLRRINTKLRNVAVFRHYREFDDGNTPGHRGDIQIGAHQDGWVWAIPIAEDRISIGAVTARSTVRESSPEAVFDEHLSRVARIGQRLAGVVPDSGIKVETDYTYYADDVCGPGWSLVGDAGCFVDPMFSGGVFLAMATGMRAAETAAVILKDPDSAEIWQAGYANFFKTGYDTYMRLVYMYYESHFNMPSVLTPAGLGILGDPWFARLVSGDFWSKENPIAEFLRAQPRWNTFSPFSVAYGCPVYPTDTEPM